MNTEAVDPSEPTESSDPADFPDTLALEPEFIAALTEIYEQKILFNQWMGLKVVSIKPKGIEARLTMKPELVGHFAYHRIHGGHGRQVQTRATGAKAGALCRPQHHRHAD
jgi:hypothetical protein